MYNLKEAYNLLENNILRCESELIDEFLKVYSGVNDNRKTVLLMLFHLKI